MTGAEEPFRGGLVEKLGRPHLEVQVCDRRGVPIASGLALLDTGATWSVLPERLMGPIGFAPHDCHEFEVNTPAGPAKYLMAHDHFSMVTIQWGPYRVPVLPLFSPHEDFFALGVSDFLRHFTLTLDVLTGLVALHPHPDTPTGNGAGPLRGLVVPGLPAPSGRSADSATES